VYLLPCYLKRGMLGIHSYNLIIKDANVYIYEV